MLSQSQSSFLPALEENEFLPTISRWNIFGGLFIVGAVGLGVAVAAVTQYNVTVKARGIVRPTGELRLVQSASEGPIRQILVKQNQPIKQGDTVAIVDDARLQSRKFQLTSQINQINREIKQIQAQMLSLERELMAETERRQRAVAGAEAQLSRRQRDYRDQQLTTAAQVDEAEANLSSAVEELQQAQAQLKEAEANLKSSISAFQAAEAKRNRYQPIFEKGVISRDRFEEVQLSVEQLAQTVEEQKAKVEGQQQAIERLEQARKAARARLNRSKAGLNPSNAEVVIANEQVAQEIAGGQATWAQLNREQEGLLQQQIQLQKQLAQDQQALEQVTLELEKTLIKAPISGTLFQLNLRNQGQTVRLGEEIGKIVPQNADLVIKAQVAPQDKSKLALDQKVHMRVSACPYPDYGTLRGKVINISEDTIKPPGNLSSDSNRSTQPVFAPFYEVTIKPNRLQLIQGNRKCSIDSGMEGRVDIISREETFLQFILRKARLITDL